MSGLFCPSYGSSPPWESFENDYTGWMSLALFAAVALFALVEWWRFGRKPQVTDGVEADNRG